MLLQRLTLISSLLLASGIAGAQPKCYPTIDPDLAYPKYIPIVYRDSIGVGTGWYCKNSSDVGGWIRYIIYAPYSVAGSDYHARANTAVNEILNATDMRNAANAAYAKFVTGPAGDCETVTDATNRNLCIAVRTEVLRFAPPPNPATPPPPPPPTIVWKVAPNPLSTSTPPTRPTYAWSTETQTRTTVAAKERVEVGAACDPAVGKMEKTTAYFGVLGRTDRVAVCVQN